MFYCYVGNFLQTFSALRPFNGTVGRWGSFAVEVISQSEQFFRFAFELNVELNGLSQGMVSQSFYASG